ncbi:MAG: putative glycosyltransferase [Gammaproteobacteria bacterium]|nr:putative glycosyltransferase [Gammaproteobacteria bacterium]
MPDLPAARGGVCAVVVTHHPDGGFPARLGRIVRQVGGTVVVDNGSSADVVEMLRGACSAPSLTWVWNVENLGIAQALNIGVRHALADGYAYALLLDQDTEVDPDMVERLVATHASCPDPQRVAIVGSRFRDTKGRASDSRRLAARGENWQEVESVITSGTLLSLAAYAAIGPFRDEFFIDYVDTEFCFRARAAGYRVVETLRPLMAHTVGAPTAHKLLWWTKWTTNHSADRRYYIARNDTVMLREYGTSGRDSWLLKSLTRCFRLCKRIVFFEPDKLRKIVAVGQGWWDGVRGNMGPRRRHR